MISRRRFLQVVGAGAGVGALTGGYTWKVEPHWLEFVHRRMAVGNLPGDLVGKLLVQISDLHVGPQVDDGYLKDAFQRVRELKPDYVVYTGDFITHAPDYLTHSRAAFQDLPHGRRGTVGVLGNHDYGIWWGQPDVAAQVAELAGKAGVRILRNQAVEIDGLHVVGLDDLWAGRFNLTAALKGFPATAAAVALSHNPDTVDLPRWDGFSGWILSGHTHGGQCKPPFLPPPLLPVQNRNYVAGEYPLSGGRRMYINRGLGHLLGVRFNVRPEITVFHLG